MSGYAGDAVAGERGLDPEIPFIQKPFNAVALTGRAGDRIAFFLWGTAIGAAVSRCSWRRSQVCDLAALFAVKDKMLQVTLSRPARNSPSGAKTCTSAAENWWTMPRTSCPRNIASCINEARNWWTRPQSRRGDSGHAPTHLQRCPRRSVSIGWLNRRHLDREEPEGRRSRAWQQRSFNSPHQLAVALSKLKVLCLSAERRSFG
jgi:hypothetical protein